MFVMTRRLIPYIAFLFACAGGHAAAAETVVLKGCLEGGSRHLYLGTVGDSQVYTLTGNTSALTKYVQREVSIEGNIDQSSQPSPSFHVLSLKHVFEAPQAKLNVSFGDSSIWKHERDEKYGIEFAHPPAWSRIPDSEWSMVEPNFAADQDAVIVGRFGAPLDLYPNSNFVDGTFGIFVNPRITNPQSCAQFGSAESRFISSHVAGGIEYSTFADVGAAAGTDYMHRDFHTFQNGLCYQISFEFGEWDTANSDTGCTVPPVKEADEWKVIDPLLATVSFSKPSIPMTPNESGASAAPRVMDFKASSDTADTAANRGQITLSWQTENADYVQLSYQCFPAPNGAGVSISEANIQRGCENNAMHLGGDMRPNHSPNASVEMLFGNFLRPEPISIRVTLTPFSRAMAYPTASKSLTVQVDAFNPFPGGVPAANGHVTLTYTPGVGASGRYRQGSPLTIQWRDNGSLRDACVNLYLVQDDGKGGLSYRLHIGDACLKPVRAGSYRWTIPNNYAGSGYRIFARAPGGSSSGSGAEFEIVPGGR